MVPVEPHQPLFPLGRSAFEHGAQAGPVDHPLRRGRFRLTPKRVVLMMVGLVVFLAISLLLARWLQVENIERDDDLELIQAEARGDARAMFAMLPGCSADATCAAAVRTDAGDSRLRRAGAVKILQLESTTAYSLTGGRGETRFAWTVIGKLPVVQCIDVKRTGNFFSGVDVALVRISTPIANEADC
jgi:hypothetical protein